MSWLTDAARKLGKATGITSIKGAIGAAVGAIPVVGSTLKTAIAGAAGGGSKPPSITDAIKAELDKKVDELAGRIEAGRQVLSVASQADAAARSAGEWMKNPVTWAAAVGIYLIARGRR